jgi:hypothetical protein
MVGNHSPATYSIRKGVKAFLVLKAYLIRNPEGNARDAHLGVDVCLLE